MIGKYWLILTGLAKGERPKKAIMKKQNTAAKYNTVGTNRRE